MGDKPVVALAALHFWEEPSISGKNGTGAVFFSGCNLGCVYCQNNKISHSDIGKTVTAYELCDIYFELKKKGAENISIITGTHFLPQIIESIKLAKSKNISLPFVYNTSGYEKIEAIEKLSDVIDVFLPDYKYYFVKDSFRYSSCRDYPSVAFEAILKMVEMKGKPIFENSMIKRGVIIRHLVLPGKIIESKMAIKKLFDKFANNVYYSIMSQFTPTDNLQNYPEINRRITESEYHSIVDYSVNLGIENAYIQDLASSDKGFIPNF